MTARVSAAPMRVLAAVLALMVGLSGLALLAPTGARADTAPPAGTPATVSADGLPTTQINGVAWSQVVVGNTVYVGGEFTSARPAGAALGTQETPRANLLAYDIRTGELIQSFAHDLNGQVLVVAASPDGSRIYIGGDFTTVDGQPRKRVAAFDTASGALTSFNPNVSGQVAAIAATNSTVYLGGNFTAVGSIARTRLAAVSADGSLLPWAPLPGVGSTAGNRDGNTATSNAVLALVVTSGGNQVVAGGRFDSMNGVKATGVAAMDAVTGATRPFAINQLITNQGINSAIYSLSTDGTTVYGTAYDFYGPGNLEGSFAAKADGGAVVEINDCRGDTYSNIAIGGVLYLSSHAHDCANIGAYPEQPVRVHKFATAITTTPTGVNGTHTLANSNFVGKPAGGMLDWFPTLTPGTYTGAAQAGWSVSGNDQYVVYGGEFPRVNGVPQQGLVRFAVPSIAPNKVGPTVAPVATVTSPMAGVASIAWTTTSDQDNQYLTYSVYREGVATPVYETVAPSTWWQSSQLSATDAGVSGSLRYRVVATDPFGNKVNGDWLAVDVAPAPVTGAVAYPALVKADGASNQWRLGETSGTAADAVGTRPMTVGSGVSRGVSGALTGDTDTAYSFNGSTTASLATQTATAAPNTFTAEAWFQTTSTLGGRILGFASSAAGTSSTYDRQIYLNGQGRVNFGVEFPKGKTTTERTVTSSASFRDGKWHHVAASLSPAGMVLYVDGKQVGARTDTTVGQSYNGYFRVGSDRAMGGSNSFTGRIDEVALYPTALSAAQVTAHAAAGGITTAPNLPPTARIAATATGLAASFDATGSTDVDGTIASYAWKFGDGTTGTGATASRTYTAAGSYLVTLTVTDNRGGTSSASRLVKVAPLAAPKAAFTAAANHLAVSFDGSTSTDADGSVTSYAWNFGDGTTGSGRTASHTYADGGTYTVTLVVTDDSGLTGTTSSQVTVTPNQAPTAAFATSVSHLALAVDGSASADPDGPLASFAWNFGDGTTGTGATATHTYVADGTYSVTLTVTDADGVTGTTTQDVSVAAPVVLATDTFNRTVSGGLGTADVGGLWTSTSGPSRQSVAPGAATFGLAAPGNLTGSALASVSQTSADVLTTFSLSAAPTGTGTAVYVTGRRVGTNLEYRARVRFLANGTVGLVFSKLTGTATEALIGTEVIVPGLTYTPGTELQARVRVWGTGTTQLSATVWAAGTPEPVSPQVTTTDTTASLQAPGGLALSAYLYGSATAPMNVRFTTFGATSAD